MKLEKQLTIRIKAELRILERLIFRSKNNDCEKVFKLAELDQLILHQ